MSNLEADSQKPKRQRRGGLKSRLGCLTCKIRRIKCDETPPYCQKCLGTGRHCEGFAANVVPNGQVRFAPPFVVNSVLSLEGSVATEKEFQHLDTFRRLFVAGISGCRKISGWESLILQAMHEEPAVRHAAIAFSALQMPDQEETPHASPKGAKSFALEQYGKSVIALQKLLGNHDLRSINTALICSILYISFEVLDGSHELAQQHLDYGLRVLYSNNVENEITQAFARLDVQASTYVARRLPTIAPVRIWRNVAFFTDIEDSEAALYQELSRVWFFLRNEADYFRYREPGNVPLHILAEAETIQLRLATWRVAFMSLLEACEPRMSSREARQAKLLQIHYHTAAILMIGSLYAEEKLYDAYDEIFEIIVRLSAELHRYLYARASVKVFSIDMAIIQPLFVASTKCRVAKIRQQAIELLQAVPNREGVWYGQLMAKIALWVKEIEEDGLDETFLKTQRVPEFRRVHSVYMNVDPKARRAGIYCKLRPNGMDGEWEDIEHLVTW